jgi:uncharacterized protein involved in type VI secretion and phage assembly
MSLMNGVVVGLVTNVSDPKKNGNVKVHFPWLDDQHESDWIRIATTMSGNGRGTFFMPEVNDEVLVAFEHGDARFPYIVGFLWNGKDAAPETNVNKRTIKSKKGHTVVLDDGDDSEKVTVKSSSGHQIVLDDTGAGKTVTIQTAGSLAVVLDDKDSSIEMRGGGRKIAMRGGIVQVT